MVPNDRKERRLTAWEQSYDATANYYIEFCGILRLALLLVRQTGLKELWSRFWLFLTTGISNMARLQALVVVLLTSTAWSWLPKSQPSPNLARSMTSTAAKTDSSTTVSELLSLARRYGPIGASAPEDIQQQVKDLVSRLPSTRNPAKVPLTGVHSLLYSDSTGGSSGRLFGPVYGQVVQRFVDDRIFQNIVNIGPLAIVLTAEREILNGSTIKVSFRQTQVEFLGQTLLQKEIGGGGAWKVLYTDVVQENGQEKLVRVLQAPSIFILEQPLAWE